MRQRADDPNDPSHLASALHSSERLRHAVLNTVLDAIVSIDPQGTIEMVNVSTERLFGYAAEEMIGQNVRMLMPEPYRSAHDGYLRAYSDTGEAKIIGIGRIVRAQRKDGTTFPIHLAVGETEIDGQPIYTGVIHDMTEQVRAQEELASARERLELAINGTLDGIWDIDLITGERYWSPRMSEMLGLAPGAPIDVADLLEPEYKSRVDAAMEQHLREGTIFDEEFRCILPNGEVRWFHSRGRAVRDSEGKPIRMVGAVSDVTQRRESMDALAELTSTLTDRIEERTTELRFANAELERASRAKDEFLTSMSHELRTPLNAILGMTEALSEGVYGEISDEQLRALGTVDESGRHLLSLINDILDLTRVASGQMVLESEPVIVEEVCSSALAFVRTRAGKKALHLVSTVTDDKLVIVSDGRRLKQILINLLSNAVKFTPDGGRVLLDARVRPDEHLIEFHVEDTGIGIPAEKLKEIFEPFKQIDSKLSREYEGTGLGLALVTQLVEAFGGRLTVKSEIGRGSEFVVAIPYREVDKIPVVESGPIGTIRKAVVIEDEPGDVEKVQRYLQSMSIQVKAVLDPASALDAIREFLPDVILLDILMPSESGWNFLRRLRQTPDLANIPVVVVSILDDVGVSLSHGAVAHLRKPYDRDELRRVLGVVAGRGATPEVRRGSSCKVLMAEDNEANIRTVGDYLRNAGFGVVVARNGIEAVELAESENPDMILMDIQMPLLDGIEATRRIRAMERTRRPIVAMTALVMPGDREKCIEAGVDVYLSKPLQLRSLVEKIRQLTTREV